MGISALCCVAYGAWPAVDGAAVGQKRTCTVRESQLGLGSSVTQSACVYEQYEAAERP